MRLGYALSYAVEATTFRVTGPAGASTAAAIEADLGRYTASPASFRDNALGRLDALLAEVERGLDAHEAQRATYGAYEGDGRPPDETLVALDLAEETRALARAATEIGAMRAAVEADYAAMHAALVRLVPPGV